MQCAQSLLKGDGTLRGDDEVQLVEPASAGRRGPLPALVMARDEDEEAALITERMQQAHRDGLSWQEMAVLCRTRAQMRAIEQALRRAQVPLQSMNTEAFKRFDWGHASAKLLTLHSAKGLEFSWVCVAGLQAMPLRDEAPEDALRQLYAAMTRATRQLLLTAHGELPVVRRVQQALHAVAQHFAAP